MAEAKQNIVWKKIGYKEEVLPIWERGTLYFAVEQAEAYRTNRAVFGRKKSGVARCSGLVQCPTPYRPYGAHPTAKPIGMAKLGQHPSV